MIRNVLFKGVLFMSLLFSVFCVCFPSAHADAKDRKAAMKVEQMMDKMTLREKVGQLFIVQPEFLTSSCLTEINSEIIEDLKEYPVGGFVLFNGNLETASQTRTFLSDLQKNSSIPLFMAIDEEGGDMTWISKLAQDPKTGFNAPVIPPMAEIGATKSTRKAKKTGKIIGTYLKDLGFNLDFAPVADINTNPKNIVIGERSFGNTPKLVTSMVKAELKGLHSAGVMGCTKHYPGHGDTTDDTHKGAVVQTKTWEELLSGELVPFIKTAKETDMIMASHITVSNVDPSQQPTTLSEVMLTEKLRKELGYQGVIITDSMLMNAVSDIDHDGDTTVKAILAGADIVLMPLDIKKSFDRVVEAVENGTITEERIDESLRRILALKVKYL